MFWAGITFRGAGFLLPSANGRRIVPHYYLCDDEISLLDFEDLDFDWSPDGG